MLTNVPVLVGLHFMTSSHTITDHFKGMAVHDLDDQAEPIVLQRNGKNHFFIDIVLFLRGVCHRQNQ